MTELRAAVEATPQPPALGRAASVWAKVDIPSLMPYVYVLILAVAIYLLEPALINGQGAIDIRFGLVVPLALVAFGQSLAIFTRGIDLSIGGVISLTTALLATHLNSTSGMFWLELLAVVAIGVAIGSLNGLLIAVTSMQPFIVTLATWLIWGGVAFAVMPIEGGVPSSTLVDGVFGAVGGVPKSVWLIALLFALWIWLRRTRFMVDVLAIGSDEARARLSGVPLVARKVQVYAISGGLAALAGIWLTGTNAQGSPTSGNQFILWSVAAVVLGGTSIFGGKGSIASALVGAITFLMIPDLVFALGLESFWSIFLQGTILVLAVTSNSLLQRRLVR